MKDVALYALRTDGDQWRITKFVDGDVESSYLTTHQECDCPAGHRHTCRHRQMLPQMLAHGICNSHYFMAYDMGGAIVDFNGTPKRLFDELALTTDPPSRTLEETEQDTLPVPEGQRSEPLPPGDYIAEIGNISEDGRILSVTNTKPWRRL